MGLQAADHIFRTALKQNGEDSPLLAGKVGEALRASRV
jgi:hypothetical protein